MDTPSTLLNTPALVISKTTGSYGVQAAGQSLTCTLAARLRPEQVVVGDQVRLAAGPGNTGLVIAVLPRRNHLARRGVPSRPGAHVFEQVIAANVDQLAPVFAAASPAPMWNLLDRYLAVAGALGLPALIVTQPRSTLGGVTKADLAPAGGAGDLDETLDEYRRLGYRVVLTSAVAGAHDGLDDLRDALGGRVSVLLGKSGVGKTSLLNALEPGLGLRVAEVSRATGKGRHTTTQVQLFPLAGDPAAARRPGGVIDTPGTREFGLWDIEPDELAQYFPEMRPLVGQCKFGLDCRHDEEPGCAIRQAVMAGAISPRRYQSYLRLALDA
jgi:ribosome biogenesis GTPase / thiamine phosphate phosphatase